MVLFIAIGFVAGRQEWIRASAVKDLSNLVFMVLSPALLFRTMSTVHIEDLNFGPVGIYFAAFGVLYFATLAWQGFNRLAAARALANTFSNTLMIGVPLVGLVFGDAGLVTLFTLISVHSLILLTAATVVFELAAAREHAGQSNAAQPPMWRTVLGAVRNGVLHPVPLPILAGLLFAQTGLVLPPVVDKPLLLLGNAFGPISLVLVGVSLAATPLAGHWRAATEIVVSKNLVLPLLVGLSGWALGIQGLQWTVIVVAAALPIGANVFLFAQRYEVAQEVTTASMGLSTVLALVTLSATMTLMSWIN